MSFVKLGVVVAVSVMSMAGCTGTCTVECTCNGQTATTISEGVTRADCEREANVSMESGSLDCRCTGDWSR